MKRKGRVRQFTADEPRLSEAVELYRLLGYEVHLEPGHSMRRMNYVRGVKTFEL